MNNMISPLWRYLCYNYIIKARRLQYRKQSTYIWQRFGTIKWSCTDQARTRFCTSLYQLSPPHLFHSPTPLHPSSGLNCCHDKISIPRTGRLWLWYWYPKICSDMFPRTGILRWTWLPLNPRHAGKYRKYGTFPTAILPLVTSILPSRLVYRCPNSNSYLPQ